MAVAVEGNALARVDAAEPVALRTEAEGGLLAEVDPLRVQAQPDRRAQQLPEGVARGIVADSFGGVGCAGDAGEDVVCLGALRVAGDPLLLQRRSPGAAEPPSARVVLAADQLGGRVGRLVVRLVAARFGVVAVERAGDQIGWLVLADSRVGGQLDSRPAAVDEHHGVFRQPASMCRG